MAVGEIRQKKRRRKALEKKNRVFSQIDVQECHLRTGLLFASHLKEWQVYVV
jgi:hypothetical protein